jgi:hypothetical protein
MRIFDVEGIGVGGVVIRGHSGSGDMTPADPRRKRHLDVTVTF